MVERQLNELLEKIEELSLKGDGREKEIGNLRKEVRRLAEDVSKSTQEMKDYMQAMDNWKVQFLLDTASAPRVAPVLGVVVPNAYPAGTPESVMSLSITFNPRTNFNSVVPISEVTAIASLIACYKPRKNGEMPVVPEDNLIKVSTI